MKRILLLAFLLAAVGSSVAYITLNNSALSAPTTSTSSPHTSSANGSSADTTSASRTATPPRLVVEGARINNLEATINGLRFFDRAPNGGYAEDGNFRYSHELYLFRSASSNVLTVTGSDASSTTVAVTYDDKTLCEHSVSGTFEVQCSFAHRPLYNLSQADGSTVQFDSTLSANGVVEQLTPWLSTSTASYFYLMLNASLHEKPPKLTAIPDLSSANRQLTLTQVKENKKTDPPVRDVSLPSGVSGEIWFRMSGETPRQLAPLSEDGEVYGVAALRTNTHLFYIGTLDIAALTGVL